eukprot:SAG11_NODE_23867_length_382_cov_0.544170_1_plen_81_part_01
MFETPPGVAKEISAAMKRRVGLLMREGTAAHEVVEAAAAGAKEAKELATQVAQSVAVNIDGEPGSSRDFARRVRPPVKSLS